MKFLPPQPIATVRYVFFCFAMCSFIYPVVVAWTWSCSGWLNYVGAGCAALFIPHPIPAVLCQTLLEQSGSKQPERSIQGLHAMDTVSLSFNGQIIFYTPKIKIAPEPEDEHRSDHFRKYKRSKSAQIRQNLDFLHRRFGGGLPTLLAECCHHFWRHLAVTSWSQVEVLCNFFSQILVLFFVQNLMTLFAPLI